MIQEAFLELIKAQLTQKTSLIEEVATVLDISYDAAHRRVSKKSKLSLDEGISLAKYFGISIDQLFSNEEEHIVAVKKTAPVTDIESLLAYYINSYNSLLPLVNDTSVEMIYSAKDLPIFYTSGDNILTRFKMYAWLKILSPNVPELSFSNFNPSLSLLEAAKKLGNLYNNFNSTEIWDITTINSTLKQIHFYFESHSLTSKDALAICDDLQELIYNISKKIVSQKDTFKFYYNELLLMNNRVLVKSKSLKSLYVPFTILSYYRTSDVKTCNQAEDFLKIQMEGSKLLSTAGEKERNMFFNKMNKKIEALRTLITANSVLEFE
ncbi:hypothetical protein [Aquimarina sp. 2201CG5-10]|uniref:hypothetical protein n=1 Tax=Aquimarina callyspongiae TaxID=3098150 RepID=UPI002AB56285|nr:hypothetical protein [Aquimarina sp. 2201CG5-10]MDY8138827.1 hypothetical protein [Aquimarina sp. 2201CG5-10]